MIVGIGTDLCDMRRIERVLDRFGERFLLRAFTDAERFRENRGKRAVSGLAGRWAAKEACAKALGTGIGSGIAWRDIEVRSMPTGQPRLHLAGRAAGRLQELTPAGSRPRLHLSMTHEPPWAQASVVIEAVPIGAAG